MTTLKRDKIFVGNILRVRQTASIIYLEYISCHTWPHRYDRGKGYLTCFSIYILCAILVQHLQIIVKLAAFCYEMDLIAHA